MVWKPDRDHARDSAILDAAPGNLGYSNPGIATIAGLTPVEGSGWGFSAANAARGGIPPAPPAVAGVVHIEKASFRTRRRLFLLSSSPVISCGD